jgi:hypothetical protein
MRAIAKGWSWAGLVVAAACGGSSSSSSPGDGGAGSGDGGGASAMQACQDEAHASCAERDTCSLGGFLNELDYGSVANCESRTATVCVQALAAKGTAQTPAKIETCVAAYPSYACTAYLDSNPPAACVPPAGSLGAGAACGAAAQCASTYCATGPSAVCGTCAPLPIAGAACQVQADCGRDLACAKPAGAATSTMGACAAWVATGGACLTGTAPCAAGLACVGEVVTVPQTMGRCEAQGQTVGAACDGSRKSMATCDGTLGLVCIPAAKGSAVGTCREITLVGVGQPCGTVGSNPITGYADCQAGFCQKASATATSGTCAALIADGAPCSEDPTTPPCEIPAKCVPGSAGSMTGTCQLPNAATCM